VKEVMRKRFIADCGRGFWAKSKCETHEQNCACWTNPRNQTCKTCIHGSPDAETDQDGAKPSTYWECSHKDFNDHANELGLDYISVKCPLWAGKPKPNEAAP
jgi:hypothetical protein